MAIKKSKAPAGMNPIDAADWEKYGSFVHGESYVSGGAIVRDAKGNLVKPYTEKAKPKVKKESQDKNQKEENQINLSHFPVTRMV